MARDDAVQARAFSLIELMVSIGVIGILLGLLLPALAHARREATTVRSLANVRQLAGVITMYSEGSQGLYPAIEEGRYYPNLHIAFAYPYWQVFETWTGVVWDVLPYRGAIEVYVSPGSQRLRDPQAMPWPTSYHMSTSFAAQPRLWTPDATGSEGYRRAARTDQVVYPSSKALLWDDELPLDRNRVKSPRGDLTVSSPMAMADESVSNRMPAQAAEAFPNPEFHAVSNARLHNTPEGVRGRDY